MKKLVGTGLIARRIVLTQAAVRRHTVANHENGVMCTVAGCSMRVARWRLKYIFELIVCYSPCKNLFYI
ncbi:hypothetical protein NECAME_09660 [Necator americanus]|uniref:Uncharacterized protein n=1 Tax=Necator americanus TaxID=51031 RepID=W2TCC2_NECAM|nr:hypothetical protein NECAME_09660 [Necator americanus]ETN79700.1 hypothetical protein NECAME_09660 [Necator americanus]